MKANPQKECSVLKLRKNLVANSVNRFVHKGRWDTRNQFSWQRKLNFDYSHELHEKIGLPTL